MTVFSIELACLHQAKSKTAGCMYCFGKFLSILVEFDMAAT